MKNSISTYYLIERKNLSLDRKLNPSVLFVIKITRFSKNFRKKGIFYNNVFLYSYWLNPISPGFFLHNFWSAIGIEPKFCDFSCISISKLVTNFFFSKKVANKKQEAFCLTHLNFFLFLQYFMLYLYTGRHYNCISTYNINKNNDK